MKRIHSPIPKNLDRTIGERKLGAHLRKDSTACSEQVRKGNGTRRREGTFHKEEWVGLLTK